MLPTTGRVGSSANEHDLELYRRLGEPALADTEEYYFRGDVFSVKEVGQELGMKRYYKNDWSGLITAGIGYVDAQLIALDCRQKGDSPDEILDLLEKHGYYDE